MMANPVAIVLGGTSPHIELIKNLKNRGYYVILVDYYENPPAKICADEHLQESALDKDKVLEIAQRRKASLVLSCCVDKFIPVCSYVSEKLKTPFPISQEAAINVTDKALMKAFMKKNEIPTGEYIRINNSLGEEIKNLNFPIVVKPVDSEGSIGVSYVDSSERLSEKANEAFSISKNGAIIIEEFCTGEEIQADFFIKNNKPELLLVRQKLKKRTPDGVFVTLGSIIPIELNTKLNELIHNLAKKIADELNINNTPLLIQAVVDGDELKILEFTARIGGQLSYKIIKKQTGIDIIDAFVGGVLNENVNLEISKSEEKLLTYIIHANQGVYGSFSGHEDFIKNKTIKDFVEYKTKGMPVPEDLSARSRIGAISFTGKNIQELISKYNSVMSTLAAKDLDNGNDLIHRDLIIDFDRINLL
jgi:phosphoribosylamine-glycine ligase